MSTTLENAKPARRSRLEIVEAALAKDEQALEDARSKFVELAAAEDQAVREAKHAEPEKSPYGLRSPAQLIRDEREKLERSISGLEKGILALRAERDGAAAEAAVAELDEKTRAAKKLAEAELEAGRQAVESFLRLVDDWGELADVLSQRSQLAVGVAELERQVSLFQPEARSRWEAASSYVVEPVPVDLRGFLDELLEASTGERTDIEAEHRAVDEINARRREIAAKDPGGPTDLGPLPKPVIQPNPLDELVPDLRGKIATAEVGGVSIRRRENPEIAWPGETA